MGRKGMSERMTMAFDEIYVAHFKYVYRFVLSLCRDEILAEEIAQEAFFKAVKSVDNFKADCSMQAWLCQIAKNTYFNHIRRRRFLSPGAVVPDGQSPSAEAELLTTERTRALHGVLHTLDEPFKEVFTLKVFAELSHAEIAKLYGKTESWSRVTYYRAKQRLLTMIKEDKL